MAKRTPKTWNPAAREEREEFSIAPGYEVPGQVSDLPGWLKNSRPIVALGQPKGT